jgi:hypothetical protein
VATTLPPPLPPETRTVGQLVAEAVRLYGRRFWPSLALGVGPALVGIGLTVIPGLIQLLFVLTAGSALLTASYIGAAVITADAQLTRGSLLTALAAGVLAFLPVPFLYNLLILPAVAWLAFFGFAVPAAVIERCGLKAAFRRSLVLARADPVHAVGGLATLAIVGLLTSFVLFFLLRGQGEATLATAAFLSVLVISPVLFLGATLLYFDQEARVRSAKPTRR